MPLTANDEKVNQSLFSEESITNLRFSSGRMKVTNKLMNDHTAAPPPHALEVLGAGWFAEDALPPDIDPGHVMRIPHAFRVWRGEEGAFFDR